MTDMQGGVAAGARRAVLLAAVLLAAGGDALASLNAHYLGTALSGAEFRLYIDGGEFLGRSGEEQAIRATLHQLRHGRLVHAGAHCIYRFDDRRRSRDRIECPHSPGSPLAGVVYTRPKQPGEWRSGDEDLLVCVRGCNGRVPRQLLLEAEGDNH